VKTATDIAVPWKNFRKMYDFYKTLACQSKMDYANFGHIGENHLHFNFLPKNDTQAKQAREYIMEFCRRAVSLGGTVSAEHGIGKIKKPYLKIMYNQQGIKEMAALKKYFDPYCLLGLDNIFDKELLSG
jgi:D-lactate dehydrogenase (cytochrome)